MPVARGFALRRFAAHYGLPKDPRAGPGSVGPLVPTSMRLVLELSVIAISVVAFVLFDLYTRACERI